MLAWLRKLLGFKPAGKKSLLDIARETDSEKTRRVLAKKPVQPPPQILAQVLTSNQERSAPPRPKPSPGATLAAVMQSEAAAAQTRMQPRGRTEAAPVLAEVLRRAPETGPRPASQPTTPANQTPLAHINASAEEALSRRIRPTVAPQAAPLPVEAWSKKQQDAAMRGKAAPTVPDNSKLHQALSKEDGILRAMAAKSAAKQTAERSKKPLGNKPPGNKPLGNNPPGKKP